MSESAVSVRGAVKRFREVRALDGVSVEFERGRIHGLIGRNGSGKTVLLKCICGFMSLNEGEIDVAGKRVVPTRPQDVGLIIESPGFIGGYSGMKNLELLAAVRGRVGKDELRAAMRAVGLEPGMRKPVRKYSLGMRQRLGIAQAIMEDPDILLLDEPMNGLDNAGVRDMRNLFKELRARGKTIILASHNPLDIEELCDTVCEMDAGRLTRVRGC
ncbi:MAG: ABC transporter ATP-binding protein [Candidatus Fimadaptatus sp.]|jgi:ABC-2 type transport system ATP-binding protein